MIQLRDDWSWIWTRTSKYLESWNSLQVKCKCFRSSTLTLSTAHSRKEQKDLLPVTSYIQALRMPTVTFQFSHNISYQLQSAHLLVSLHMPSIKNIRVNWSGEKNPTDWALQDQSKTYQYYSGVCCQSRNNYDTFKKKDPEQTHCKP